MTFRKQLRWGGLLIILASLLMNVMNILVYAGYHNIVIQAVYGVGFTGLVLACTLIHLAHARKAGAFGSISYIVTILSLAYANITIFLILAELAGIREAYDTLVASWEAYPLTRFAVYGSFIGFGLLGISIAAAGVLPRWSGILIAVGAALQIPAQYALELAGPLLFIFAIGGSVLFGTGLIWIGWEIWSDNGRKLEEPGLSNLDRIWGGPIVIFTGLILAIDAMVNMFGGLSLTSGITHLLSYTALVLTGFFLYAAHGDRASWLGGFGFVLVHLGAVLYIITAYLIVAQLAGVIDNNQMLMASWEDIPIGRVSGYMVIIGLFFIGLEGIRSEVFPHWSGWLVVTGIALAIPFTFTIQAYFLGIFWVIGATIEGIGIAWMGWVLLVRKYDH